MDDQAVPQPEPGHGDWWWRLIAITLGAALFYIHRANLKQLAITLLLAALPAAAIALPVYGWLLYRVGLKTLAEDCHLFYTHLPTPLVFYNAQRSGLAEQLAALLQMLGGAAVGLAAVSLIVWLSLWRQASK